MFDYLNKFIYQVDYSKVTNEECDIQENKTEEVVIDILSEEAFKNINTSYEDGSIKGCFYFSSKVICDYFSNKNNVIKEEKPEVKENNQEESIETKKTEVGLDENFEVIFDQNNRSELRKRAFKNEVVIIINDEKIKGKGKKEKKEKKGNHKVDEGNTKCKKIISLLTCGLSPSTASIGLAGTIVLSLTGVNPFSHELVAMSTKLYALENVPKKEKQGCLTITHKVLNLALLTGGAMVVDRLLFGHLSFKRGFSGLVVHAIVSVTKRMWANRIKAQANHATE